MAESSQHPLPHGDAAAGAQSSARVPRHRRALAVTAAIMLGGAVTGVLGGLVWSAIAPRPLFVVASHGVAYVVNPETRAFIAGDGWFSIVAVIGGLLIGLAGYFLGVRRYGPLPVVGVLAGATAGAFLAWWTGRHVGLAAFRHLLGTSKTGTLIRQPADLGAHGALAFWPLAAGVVIGGIELVISLRERQRGSTFEPVIPAPLPFGSAPPRPSAHPDQHHPGHYGSSQYESDPDHYGSAPAQYESGPPQYENGPAQYENGPAQYDASPDQYDS